AQKNLEPPRPDGFGRERFQGGLTSQRSELDTSRHLNIARIADGTIPLPEGVSGTSHVRIEGVAGAVALVHEVVVIEEVEKVRRELEAHPFGNLCVLGKRNVPILVRRSIDRGNRFSVSGVTVRGEVAFKGQGIQVLRAVLRRIEAVPSMHERILTGEKSRNARLAEVTQTGVWAVGRGEGHGNAPLVAIEWADLPSADERIHWTPSA